EAQGNWPGWTWGIEVLDLRHRLRIGLQDRLGGEIDGARVGRGHGLDRRPPRGDDHLADPLRVGVEPIGGGAGWSPRFFPLPCGPFTCLNSSARRRPPAPPR